MSRIDRLKVKLFADGADITAMRDLARNPLVKGFTTNPSLVRKAGVTDYRAFARAAIEVAGDRPISFEVFSDDLPTMAAQARAIARWGDNVYVKIPISNTAGLGTISLIGGLLQEGIKVNATAILTLTQVHRLALMIEQAPRVPIIVSVFAGRIADCGSDPVITMQIAATTLHQIGPHVQLLWASVRQPFDLFQADHARCDIITMPPAMIAKLAMVGRNLADYSRTTAQEFHQDALAAGYQIPLDENEVQIA